MMIAVLANDEQWNELIAGYNEAGLVRIASLPEQDDSFDGYIVLEGATVEQLNSLNKPVLLNAVITTLTTINAGVNICRINGWNSFLSRKTWEVAGKVDKALKNIFSPLNRELIQVADEPGLVAARTIAMIVNEAYFALGEAVSSTTEIDTAIKLGTNYPSGPFDWAQKIGVYNIYALLLALSKADDRYLPAPLLQQAANA